MRLSQLSYSGFTGVANGNLSHVVSSIDAVALSFTHSSFTVMRTLEYCAPTFEVAATFTLVSQAVTARQAAMSRDKMIVRMDADYAHAADSMKCCSEKLTIPRI